MKDGFYKISELSRKTGVASSAIKYYIAQGLLPKPKKTFKNMAFYDESYISRIKMIKELQSKRFLPLKVIKKVLQADKSATTIKELKIFSSLQGNLFKSLDYSLKVSPVTRTELIKRTGVDEDDLKELEQLKFIEPKDGLYSEEDIIVVENAVTFRKFGFRKELGFKVRDLKFILKLTEQMAEEGIGLFTKKTFGKMNEEELSKLARNGIQSIIAFFGALFPKSVRKILHEFGEEE
jgi:DNA-binding transcriptional MerR regulator